jgi:hypothetical protein
MSDELRDCQRRIQEADNKPLTPAVWAELEELWKEERELKADDYDRLACSRGNPGGCPKRAGED